MAGQQQGCGRACQKECRMICKKQNQSRPKTQNANDNLRRFSGLFFFTQSPQQGKRKKTKSGADKPKGIYRIYGGASENHGTALVDKRLRQHKGKKT